MADVDDTCQLAYILWVWPSGDTLLLRSGILNFGPCAARSVPELSQVGRDDPPQPGCLLVYFE